MAMIVCSPNIKHSSKQPHMHASKLHDSDFGPFHTPTYHLQPGMKQSMTFSDTDAGLCYMLTCEQIERRFDIENGSKVTNMTTSELMTLLKNLGTTNPVGNKKQIIKLC